MSNPNRIDPLMPSGGRLCVSMCHSTTQVAVAAAAAAQLFISGVLLTTIMPCLLQHVTVLGMKGILFNSVIH